MSTVLWQHAQAVWTEVNFSQHLNFINRHVLNLMFAGLFTINLLFYNTNLFCWLPILIGPGAESGQKKLLGILFCVNNLPDQIFPCSYYMNLPLALQGRLHTRQPFF